MKRASAGLLAMSLFATVAQAQNVNLVGAWQGAALQADESATPIKAPVVLVIEAQTIGARSGQIGLLNPAACSAAVSYAGFDGTQYNFGTGPQSSRDIGALQFTRNCDPYSTTGVISLVAIDADTLEGTVRFGALPPWTVRLTRAPLP